MSRIAVSAGNCASRNTGCSFGSCIKTWHANHWRRSPELVAGSLLCGAGVGNLEKDELCGDCGIKKEETMNI